MKKAIALVLFAAVVFTVAACAKKGERYEEPPTEVITLENGGRVVYEVVTEANGEPQTDEEGKKVYRPYDPPVTEKGGYLVTDAQGSTIKRSAAEDESVTVGSASGSAVFEDVTVPSTDANGQPIATTVPQTDANGFTLDVGGNGGKGGKKDETTTVPKMEHASTVAANGTLTQGKANKLLKILDDIENPFEEDVAESRYEEGKTSIKTYIANVQQAQQQIKADPELYRFVTQSNLDYWNYYLSRMQVKYGEFVSVIGAQKPGEKPGSAVYTSYVAFQDQYRMAIEVYYSIYEAAEPYAK